MMLCNEEKCTGCAACFSACAKNCISMSENGEGFLKPTIDNTKCVNCGVCASVCPVMNDTEAVGYLSSPVAYAAKLNDTESLRKSASGGMFVALAQGIFKKNGVVYGAAFENVRNVKHIRAESMFEAEQIRGSKYIQSDVGESYKNAKKDLENGRTVLFTGTPCQVAGLRAYLKKQYENLITVDLLCHGVPGRKLWREYIDYLGCSLNGEVTEYSFRDKTKWGWGNWGSCTVVSGRVTKKHFFPVPADYFYSLYFKENCYNESCYSCKFAKIPRQGDITIGDFWGIDKELPEFDASNGVSVATANTDAGEKLLEEISSSLTYVKTTFEKAARNNKTFSQATKRPTSRDAFYVKFNSEGFEKTAKAYVKLHKITPYIARRIPSSWKNTAKKLLRRGKPKY